MPRRVVKLGGSLLSRPDVWSRLTDWLQHETAAAATPLVTVLICGGGSVVEAIRELDRLHGLDEVDAHWWCIEVMSQQARLAQRKLPGSRYTARLDDLPAVGAAAELVVFDPLMFLREDDARQADALPEGWSVTSDSIAARVASRWGADELVLLKSALPAFASRSSDVTQLAADGFVDGHFPKVARAIERVTIVDLTADHYPRLNLSLPRG